jgi:cell wall-associated NlpC family hydrolase
MQSTNNEQFASKQNVQSSSKQNVQPASEDTTHTSYKTNNEYIDTSSALYIHTGTITPEQIVSFAETLIGVPYKYASTDPKQGFDCSGFITYVFNHFDINVPRSSVDFTNVQHEVPVAEAKPGDLILFTGTDSTIRVVGHMGIVVYNGRDGLLFIHSNSGKAHGVTITPLNDYYKGRFVKVIRVFSES